VWDTAAIPNNADLVCYVFHHWQGQKVDRSEVVVTTATCTPVPREEYDGHGLPAWYLFRSVPRRLCPRAGDCASCPYVLGELVQQEHDAAMPQRLEHGGYSLSM
jgi:hypothetical protein